jgi:hypothetical protein
VVYEVGRTGVRAAEAEAGEHCARYDRSAHLRNVAEYGDNRHLFFDCI